jgi:uncharacterized membrane protein
MVEIPTGADTRAGTPQVFFAATLTPHRSLPPRGFFWVMAIVGAMAFCISFGFVLAGAWPVTGFCGLDILLIYLAFRWSYRSARQTETVRLTDRALDIERVSIRGERENWRFEPAWARVTVDDSEDGRGRVLLSSHGRSVSLGAFLNRDDRHRVAASLKTALQRWRDTLRA